MLQFVWNYLMLMLILGALKVGLSFRWPPIGEWRYDDLHPSIRYRDSSRAKRVLVNLVFFLVYPFVLLWRWYQSSEWTDWTDVENYLFEQNIDLGEEELLRRGTLRGRMIIQKEIFLHPTASADESVRRYDEEIDEGSVPIVSFQSDEENDLDGDEVLPLNLSKSNEARSLPAFRPREKMPHCAESDELMAEDYEYDNDYAEDEEHHDGDEVALIAPSADRQKNIASPSREEKD